MSIATVGLTGGVASGKSTAAARFKALGVAVCDADQVARAVVVPGSPALQQIFSHFGSEFRSQDGSLNRRRLRERVFSDPSALRELEAITHPAIRFELQRWRDAQQGPYCILDVAILFESGFDALVDRSLVIDCPEEVQVSRLVERDQTDQDAARRILANQMSRAQRLALATDVIRNTGTPEALGEAVAVAHAHYLAWAAAGAESPLPLDLPEMDVSATISARSKPQ